MNARKPKETTVEQYLIQRVKAEGGKIAKFSSPGEAGHPDRLIKLPHRPAFLIETKRQGLPLEPLQAYQAREWEKAGMRCYKADSRESIDQALADT